MGDGDPLVRPQVGDGDPLVRPQVGDGDPLVRPQVDGLSHLFRRHVKPKKQHEIMELGKVCRLHIPTMSVL